MALIKTLTFESNSLTGSDAFDSIQGSDSVIVSTSPILGNRSYRIASSTITSTQWGVVTFTSGSAAAASFYIRRNGAAGSSGNARISAIGSGASAHRSSVYLDTTTNELYFATSSATEDSNSTRRAIADGVVYRVDQIYRNSGHGSGALHYVAITNKATNVTQIVINASHSDAGNAAWFRGYMQLNIIGDEIHVRNDATLPVLPSLVPPPTGSGVEIISPRDARIFWSAVTGAKHYRVEYSSNGGSTWTLIDYILDLFWIHIGRALGQTYLYRIAAVVSTGPEPEDEEITAPTEPIENTAPEIELPDPDPPEPVDPDPEDPPIEYTTLVVTWNPVEGATSYDLCYSLDQENWTVVTDITSPHTIEGLLAGETYYVQVRAVSANGLSNWSDPAQIKLPSDSVSAQGSATLSIALNISI